MNEFTVTGPRPWRGTPVGETFVGDPDDPSVQRAVAIKILTPTGRRSVSGIARLRVTPPGAPASEKLEPQAEPQAEDASVVTTEDGGSQ